MYKGTVKILLITIIFAGLQNCGQTTPKEPKAGWLVKDNLGRNVNLPDSAVRIFPITSSITEFLYLIVDENRIVARTQNDSFPVNVLSKPVINNYPVDFEKLVHFKPDLVLAKEGILSLENAQIIENMGIPVYYLVFENIEDIIGAARELGDILKVSDRAKYVADSIESQIKAITQSTEKADRKSVLITISTDPIYVFGKDSYATAIIEAAGGINAVDQVFNTPFPPLRREYILKINPDILIVGKPKEFFEKYPELKKIKAFKYNRIKYIDGDLISRPGPRVGITVKELQKIINEN